MTLAEERKLEVARRAYEQLLERNEQLRMELANAVSAQRGAPAPAPAPPVPVSAWTPGGIYESARYSTSNHAYGAGPHATYAAAHVPPSIGFPQHRGE